MEIRRDAYLNELIIRKNNGMIKVVTGIRRCGKTYLVFELFRKNLIESGIAPEQIIEVALDDDENEDLRDPKALGAHIRSKITNNTLSYYVLLDEVQYAISDEELHGDEPPRLYGVLNGLLRKRNVDVYVTGSNSKLLSKDVMTEFRGRGDEVHIRPLSFAEFMQVFEGEPYQGWIEYSTYGGLPLMLSMQTPQQKMNYLNRLFQETYFKDVIERNHITKTQELEDLVDILASSVGSLTNPPKIEATFKSVHKSTISAHTIRSYIDYLGEAFLIQEAKRYNVKGRRYIGSPMKYYFEDVGLRNARLGFRQTEETHLMENIVYNELKMRGFQVDVGIVEKQVRLNGSNTRSQLEIDFVANLGPGRYYIQAALQIPDAAKDAQEKASLLQVGDNFQKIVLVRDTIRKSRDNDGITTMSVYDFLLDPDSLVL